MGLLRDLIQGRPNGVRARLRRWLGGAGSELSGRDVPRQVELPPQPVEPPPSASAVAAASLEGAWVDVGPVTLLDEGRVVEVAVDGVALVLTHHEGRLVALSGECPHAGGPLADGELEGEHLTCPWHGWSFHLGTGRCSVDPSVVVPTYPAEVVDGRVRVDLGARD